jgi:hypothetical protein
MGKLEIWGLSLATSGRVRLGNKYTRGVEPEQSNLREESLLSIPKSFLHYFAMLNERRLIMWRHA